MKTPQSKRVWYAVRFALEGYSKSGRHQIPIAPQVPFRPWGLWVWGPTEDAGIQQIRVGGECQIISAGALPVVLSGFFDPLLSWADFVALPDPKDNLHLPPVLERPHQVPDNWIHAFLPPSFSELARLDNRLEFDTCNLGVQIELEYTGGLDHAVIWGEGLAP